MQSMDIDKSGFPTSKFRISNSNIYPLNSKILASITETQDKKKFFSFYDSNIKINKFEMLKIQA